MGMPGVWISLFPEGNNPSSVETGIFLENYVNTMTADDLAP